MGCRAPAVKRTALKTIAPRIASSPRLAKNPFSPPQRAQLCNVPGCDVHAHRSHVRRVRAEEPGQHEEEKHETPQAALGVRVGEVAIESVEWRAADEVLVQLGNFEQGEDEQPYAKQSVEHLRI